MVGQAGTIGTIAIYDGYSVIFRFGKVGGEHIRFPDHTERFKDWKLSSRTRILSCQTQA